MLIDFVAQGEQTCAHLFHTAAQLDEIPITIEGTTADNKLELIASLAEDSLDLDSFEFRLGDSSLAGTLHADLGDRPVISMKARSPLIDLAPFSSSKAEAEGDASADTAPGTSDSEFVFTDEPLPLDTLRKANVDVDVTIDTLRTASAEYTDFFIRFTLKDGQLKLENALDGEHGGVIENTIAINVGEALASADRSARSMLFYTPGLPSLATATTIRLSRL